MDSLQSQQKVFHLLWFKLRLITFLQESFSFGCLRGFKHFELYLRGKEELLLRVYNEKPDSSTRASYSATGEATKRFQIANSNNIDETFVHLPPASPCDNEMEKSTDQTAFLIAGYARYKCPLVWLRSNHERILGVRYKSELDYPLRLKTTSSWKTSDVHVYDIVEELLSVANNTPVSNPFAIDHTYFDTLSIEESIVCSSALLNFLNKLFQQERPYKNEIWKDMQALMKRHLNEYQELVSFTGSQDNMNYVTSIKAS
ncbi:hypothetical protein O9G_004255 [Rozella allomycis CSF55]|uniref:DUF7886 domain-containing protein n=1 Tax=Rozella allomycis (strain CSF55) TaxID=988480 RepID=A0A075AP88_ROZAC|nr:hypothetical protein O9G_004255 [Rozella allomycis CSF55]|eukprot:EPZ31864.1 hypothetical protein O9G_004255 [Rozella allomycis CSF55]